jgi:hypothetical protein
MPFFKIDLSQGFGGFRCRSTHPVERSLKRGYGYLLIYDFNKGKTYKEEEISGKDKEIFAVWV